MTEEEEVAALRSYFIEQNHTLEATAAYFNLPVGTLRKKLAAHGLKKTQKQACVNAKATFIKRYGEKGYREKFVKDPGTPRRAQKASTKARNEKAKIEWEKRGVTEEKLYHDYILKNKSLKILEEEYSLPRSTLRKLLSRYRIVKTQEARDEAKRKGDALLAADPERVAAHVAKTQATIKERYGNNWYRNTSSKLENEIVVFLKEAYPHLPLETNVYTLIKNPTTGAALQIDIYLPSISLGIEVNGDYWHDRVAFESDRRNSTTETREALKIALCEKVGVELIHIWESEWKTKRSSVEEKLKREVERASQGLRSAVTLFRF